MTGVGSSRHRWRAEEAAAAAAREAEEAAAAAETQGANGEGVAEDDGEVQPIPETQPVNGVLAATSSAVESQDTVRRRTVAAEETEA